MVRNLLSVILCLICFSSKLACANVASIRANGLPHDSPVLAALDDAQKFEPYSSAYSIKWSYPVRKEEVATRLGKDLGFLRLALKDHPDNAELLLLTGLVAHYGYNLDLEGSYDAAMDAFERAGKLQPSDIRPPWFRATMRCHTLESKAGAEEFLSIEANHSSDELPAAFWNDYLICATVTNMPAHVLRAASYLEKRHATASITGADFIDLARKRFKPYDPSKKHDQKDVWYGNKAGEEIDITSTMCGIRLRVHSSTTGFEGRLVHGTIQHWFLQGSR
jgi:hypothetical protein